MPAAVQEARGPVFAMPPGDEASPMHGATGRRLAATPFVFPSATAGLMSPEVAATTTSTVSFHQMWYARRYHALPPKATPA